MFKKISILALGLTLFSQSNAANDVIIKNVGDELLLVTLGNESGLGKPSFLMPNGQYLLPNDIRTVSVMTENGPWVVARHADDSVVISRIEYNKETGVKYVPQDELRAPFNRTGIDINPVGYIEFREREGGTYINHLEPYHSDSEAEGSETE